MRSSFSHRSTAWLTLVAVFLMGVAPSQGLVLCFEPDGTVALESASVSRACEGCDEPASDDDGAARLVSPEGECCACLDIPVDVSGDEARVAPTTVELRIDLPPALAAQPARAVLASRFAHGAPRGRAPGPPGVLEHIRSVVLRV